jgi:uncharacterized lipoprotein YmbA
MKHEAEVRNPKPEVRRWEPAAHRETGAVKPRSGARLGRLLQVSGSARLLLALAACAGLTGCFGFLKPAKPTARHFVLTSLPTSEAAGAPGGGVAVGIGPVKLASYLFSTSFAVRKGANEIEHLPAAFWGERLDSGLQRVLAANLAALIPTDQIRLSAWQIEDVSAEVYVAIERFEVDASGQGEIAAWWRILSPGGEKTLKAGECRRTRQGPAPDADPAGAVATLSELAADLSRQVAQAVKETAAAPGGRR